MLLFIVTAAVLGTAYWFWVRPMLKARPSLARFWEREDNIFTALRLKLAGLKERLTATVPIAAGAVVWLHDTIAPMVANVDIMPLTSMVPSAVWAGVLIVFPALMLFFRWLADRRAEVAIEVAKEEQAP